MCGSACKFAFLFGLLVVTSSCVRASIISNEISITDATLIPKEVAFEFVLDQIQSRGCVVNCKIALTKWWRDLPGRVTLRGIKIPVEVESSRWFGIQKTKLSIERIAFSNLRVRIIDWEDQPSRYVYVVGISPGQVFVEYYHHERGKMKALELASSLVALGAKVRFDTGD